MRAILSDLRYAFRLILKNPRFSAVAMLAMALGIGANAAIFSVVDAVLLQPLPFPEPERLVRVCRQFEEDLGCSASIPKFMIWRQAESFESVTAYDFGGPGVNLGGGDRPEQVRGTRASAGYFAVFGAQTQLGRTFTADEDRPGGANLAVLSDRLWRSRFGGDRGILGRGITLNGDPHVVIGVLAPGFRPDPAAEIFLPLQADPNSTNQGHYLSVAARLRPGVTVDRARAEVQVLAERFRRENPRWMSEKEQATVVPMLELVVEDVRPALLVLIGAVSLVLLIACANVANLLLARAAGRQREVAIRSAIGAGRGAIVRQLLTESVLLAVGGAIVGVVAGVWGARALIGLSPGSLPRASELAQGSLWSTIVDWRVLAFGIGVSLVTGLLFGLAPALHLANSDLGTTLKEGGGRGSSGRRAARTRGVLVVGEIALALVLLVGATLLIRTFVGLRQVQPGFDPENVLTLQTSLAGEKYASTQAVDRLVRGVTERLNTIPGVLASAYAISLPIEGGPDLPFSIEGRPLQGDAMYHGDEQYRTVSYQYFEALSIPLARGRIFTDRDTSGSVPVVIVNAAMAKKHWPDSDPVGQRITIGRGLGPQFEDPTREIVGIVGDVREEGLDRQAPGVMYVPVSQVPDGLVTLGNAVIPASWVVRATSDPARLAPAIQAEFFTVDSMLPISRVRTLEHVMAESIAGPNFNMLLLMMFGAIALVLAGIGIYGLMSYSVEQGTHDIGVRLALGADRSQILALVLGRGLRLTAIGLVVGALAAVGAVRVMSGMLFGVEPLDPVTFAIVIATLAAIALAACYLPARRAMAVDPIMALRQE